MSKLIHKTIQKLKRIATELRPRLLDDLGLVAAIEWEKEEFQKRSGIECDITIYPGEINLDKGRSTAIFRIFQETLTNIARHSNATKVKVNLTERQGQIVLRVKDNGVGIPEDQISNSKSLGLIGIRERAYSFGGNTTITGIPGKGTAVIVSIPLDKKE
jgi:signal transduction histidine kinase